MNSEGLTRVYVGGLNDTIKKEDLQQEFEKFGKLNTVWMAFNPPGFAFIEFLSLSEAEVACSSMNGTEIKGAKLRVEISKGRSRNSKFRGGGGGGRGDRNFGNNRSFGGSRDYNNRGGDRNSRSYGGGGGNSYGSGGGGGYGGGGKSFYGNNSSYESSRNNDGYGYSSNSYSGGNSNYSDRRSTRYRSRSPVNRTRYIIGFYVV